MMCTPAEPKSRTMNSSDRQTIRRICSFPGHGIRVLSDNGLATHEKPRIPSQHIRSQDCEHSIAFAV